MELESVKGLGSGLGSIGAMMHEQPAVVDLSWLDVTPGENYDNIPSQHNPHNVIPQLEAAWGWQNYSSPTGFIPNQVFGGADEVKVVGPEEIASVIKVVKTAMMKNIAGDELKTYLRDRFPSYQIRAAIPEITKVAAERGLLGGVYVDYSPFTTISQAEDKIGKLVLRNASYAVGYPSKEPNFLDEAGRVRGYGTPHVASVVYTPELLSKIETRLRASRKITANVRIANVQDLQNALLSTEGKVPRVRTLEANLAPAVTEKTLEAAMGAAGLTKAASMENDQGLWVSVRPILAHMQVEMLKGNVGTKLRDAMLAKYTSNTLRKYAKEISKIASLQGLMGPLYADVSLFCSMDEAIATLRVASRKPQYIVASREETEHWVGRVASITGCKPLPRTGVSVREASTLVQTLSIEGKIPAPAAASMSSRLASGDSPINIIRDAYLTVATQHAEVRTASGLQATLSTGVRINSVGDIDRASLKTAATTALSRGYTVSQVEDRVAATLPSEAVTIVASALSSIDTIPAGALENCTKERYNLNPHTRIAAATKCGSCTFRISGHCTKQACQIEGTAKTASELIAAAVRPVDLSAKYNLHLPILNASTSKRK